MEQSTARDRAETWTYRNFFKQLRVPISSASAAAVLHLSMAEYLCLFVLAYKLVYKLIKLSYSGIENWHPTLSARHHVLCKAKTLGMQWKGRASVPGGVSPSCPSRQAARAATEGIEHCNLPASCS